MSCTEIGDEHLGSTGRGGGAGEGAQARRFVKGMIAATGALSMGVVGLFALPATANPDGDSALGVEVEGTLLVVIVDPAGPVDPAAGPSRQTAQHQEDQVLLATDEGLLLSLEGIEEEVATGDRFIGTVLVPEKYFEDEDEGGVNPQSSDTGEASAASVGPVETLEVETLALESAVDSGERLLAGDFEVLPSSLGPDARGVQGAAAGTYGRQQHNVDVVILNVAGKPDVTASQALAALKRGTDFWATNAGEIITWGQPPSPKTITVNQATACEYAAAWRQALKTVGRPVSAYQNTGRHLAVYAPVDCMSAAGASGYGVIGQGGPHFGGMIWLAGDNGPITAHELGHNLSLRHSDAVYCRGLQTDVPRNMDDWQLGGLDCVNMPYEDLYDVMGAAYTLGPNWGNCGRFDLCWWGPDPLPALSSANRERLGIGESSMKRVSADSGLKQTLTVDGMGTSGATKGLIITDPVSGEKLYVDFRDGQGTEAGTVYSQGYGFGPSTYIDPGVTFSRQKVFGPLNYYGTTLLPRYDVASSWLSRVFYYRKGDTFESGTRVGGKPGISVQVSDLTWGEQAQATLEVNFGTTSNATTKRLSGADRYSTSVAISKNTYPHSKGGTVFVATGATFPDALAAGPAAAEVSAPLLLVPRAGTLPQVVAAELTRLAPTQVYIVGGEGAVSKQMAAQVRSAAGVSPEVERLGGANRYDTAARVVNKIFAESSYDDIFNWQYVFLATGRDFPDALSASAAAGFLNAPVLLTDGKSKSLDAEAMKILRRMKPHQVYVVGGTGAVSAEIESQVRTLAPKVDRLGGADRYATSREVAGAVFRMDQPYPTVASQFWATGTDFPDALSGAPAAARAGAPLYVVRPTCVPSQVLVDIEKKGTQVVNILGGEGALNADVARMRPC